MQMLSRHRAKGLLASSALVALRAHLAEPILQRQISRLPDPGCLAFPLSPCLTPILASLHPLPPRPDARKRSVPPPSLLRPFSRFPRWAKNCSPSTYPHHHPAPSAPRSASFRCPQKHRNTASYLIQNTLEPPSYPAKLRARLAGQIHRSASLTLLAKLVACHSRTDNLANSSLAHLQDRDTEAQQSDSRSEPQYETTSEPRPNDPIQTGFLSGL